LSSTIPQGGAATPLTLGWAVMFYTFGVTNLRHTKCDNQAGDD